MSALADILLRQIAVQGPLSIAEYMNACLLHPEHGYYTTRDPLGAAGDFVTAPEISQVFGELLGLCLAQAWQDRGAPSPFILAELGPGRGTLMADALRATRAVPGFHAAVQVHLVEASPVLRARQAEALTGYAPVWHENITDLPDLPLFLIGNEFFDALPIRQFLRDGAAWRERVVGLRDGALAFGLTDPVSPAALQDRTDVRQGDMVEVCAPAAALAEHIGGRIAARGGAALIVDYGGWQSLGDTFQALRAHEKVSPLAAPGLCDLTAHVAFGPMVRDVACKVARLTGQGAFLDRLGCGPRHGALARGKDEATIEAMAQAHRRLTHPAEMGQLFKVLALYSDDGPAPVGTDQ